MQYTYGSLMVVVPCFSRSMSRSAALSLSNLAAGIEARVESFLFFGREFRFFFREASVKNRWGGIADQDS